MKHLSQQSQTGWGMNFIYRYILFSFSILKFDAFRRGIFFIPHRSLWSYRWAFSLVSLTCRPPMGILVGSSLLDHCFLPALLLGFLLPTCFTASGFLWSIFFFIPYPQLSWDCIGSVLSALSRPLEILCVTLDCI